MGSCLACSADLPAGAKFCLECGTPTAQRTCPVCGVLAERGRFCAECGSPLDAGAAVSAPAAAPELPVAERRVTSVLFGDLVGFTPLSESRDAEEVRELLSSYFDRCRVVTSSRAVYSLVRRSARDRRPAHSAFLLPTTNNRAATATHAGTAGTGRLHFTAQVIRQAAHNDERDASA